MAQAERSRRHRQRHGERLRAEEKKKRRERRPEAHRAALDVDVLARCVPDGDCLIWQGAKSRGYGVFSKLGCVFKAHRIAYERAEGTIAAGHELHHRCETPACCNPTHLRPLTPRAHMAEDGRLAATAARASEAARARWG